MTTDEKFTPGPWKRGDCDSWIIWAPAYSSVDYREPEATPSEGVTVAVVKARAWAHAGVFADRREAWLAEADATSDLIAAAPDLYAALEAVLEACDLSATPADRRIHDQGVRALRKARGEAA